MSERRLISSGSSCRRSLATAGRWWTATGSSSPATTGYDYTSMTIAPDLEMSDAAGLPEHRRRAGAGRREPDDVVRVHYYLTRYGDLT